jgi:RNA polymerase sigma-70 factor (ECF subfamily)
MIAAQAGDRAAYQSLLGQCIPIIARTARRCRVPSDRIDDVVQETLITVHQARQTFDPDRSFSAWLRTLAHRRAVDFIRREIRIRQREVYAPSAYENHADVDVNASADLVYLEASGRLPQLVEVLPARQREAVKQLAFRQRTLAEAAVATGRTAGALKVNFHRALKALRAALASKD